MNARIRDVEKKISRAKSAGTKVKVSPKNSMCQPTSPISQQARLAAKNQLPPKVALDAAEPAFLSMEHSGTGMRLSSKKLMCPDAPPNHATDDGQRIYDAQDGVAGVGSHVLNEEIFNNLRGQYRRRVDFLKGKGDLERRLKAITLRLKKSGQLESLGTDPGATQTMSPRWGLRPDQFPSTDIGHDDEPKVTAAEVALVVAHYDAAAMYAAHLSELTKETNRATRACAGLVEALPVYSSFWATIKGLSSGGLSMILAEAGNLSNYSNPAKLWKRFGLAPHNGRACSTWRVVGGMSASDWSEIGYSPMRRSIMFQITDSLLKHQKADSIRLNDSIYRRVYDGYKSSQREKAAAAGLAVYSAADAKKLGLVAAQFRTPLHIHRRCHRYVAKRVLRDLWRAWHALDSALASKTHDQEVTSC